MSAVIPSKHLILEYLDVAREKEIWIQKGLNPFIVVSMVMDLSVETTNLCIVFEFYLAVIWGWDTQLYILLSPSSFSFSSLQFNELQSKDLQSGCQHDIHQSPLHC